jgi:hypothetical protein
MTNLLWRMRYPNRTVLSSFFGLMDWNRQPRLPAALPTSAHCVRCLTYTIWPSLSKEECGLFLLPPTTPSKPFLRSFPPWTTKPLLTSCCSTPLPMRLSPATIWNAQGWWPWPTERTAVPNALTVMSSRGAPAILLKCCPKSLGQMLRPAMAWSMLWTMSCSPVFKKAWWRIWTWDDFKIACVNYPGSDRFSPLWSIWHGSLLLWPMARRCCSEL